MKHPRQWPPQGRPVRVYAAGVSTETNTFSPHPARLEDFTVVTREEYETSGFREEPGLEDMRRLTLERGWEFLFGLQAFTQPAGVVERDAYESLRDQLLASLRDAMPVDIVLLPLHGAMVAEGYDYCELDMVTRVREVVGESVPIGVSFDLHCHFQQALLDVIDVLVAYKEYPHTDIGERGADLFRLTAATAAGEITPTMALFDCRMIGIYPTEVEPMRTFVDDMLAAEARGDVLSLSLAHGFPWGDVPEMGAKLIAITDDDPEGAARAAREWGMRFHDLRREVTLHPLSLDEALDRALAAPRTGTHAADTGPVVVADQADNPGGGAPGDATFALHALLERGAQDVALGMIYDPDVVQQASETGVGSRLTVSLGGKRGVTSGEPVVAEAEVLAVNPELVQDWPQAEGALLIPCGRAVALRIGGVDVVVNDDRTQVFSLDVFTKLGIDALRKRVIVLKSTQHFFTAFGPIASEVIYMGGPGAIAPRMTDIPLQRADANKYPWVDDPFATA